MGMYLILDHHRANTMWVVEKLGLYLNSMELAMDEIRREDKERIEEVSLNSAHDFDELREQLHLHELLYEKDFSSKLRYSFLILVYTMFETRTKALWQELVDRGIVPSKNFTIEVYPQSGNPVSLWVGKWTCISRNVNNQY